MPNHIEPSRPAPGRRSIHPMLAALALAALVTACNAVPSDRPLDVGNMAYPQPLPEGNLSTTAVAGRKPLDTGNMAYPQPVPAGVVSQTAVSRQAFDTGNMSYPTPLPAGNGPNTRVR